MSIYGALGMPGGHNKEGAVARGRAVICACARDSQRGGYRCQAVLSIERQERKSRRRKIQMYVWRIKVDHEL